ncbi:hypothetical protein JG687_00004186 [Phytophthora cactorum]|uniref:Uncharacterized protein n=1 Tax=Phytophthora cactorum TaxID=29920 RepID=A0A329S9K2_9STRA|nr:hypothetical protein Pcac1_g12346 [Phytophthora cactorum]KAG2830534.1 hypothetical protein PC112_g7650 [Phytophthora cactorum]KAG2832027.1 hypothetical protein PC111_g6777 [Phytophthora cactorum]KAG2859730.1 hypothetical protein PC113_g8688 [Phytophthora cactorum]KAG2914519.1 hypothetical protein PC114_g8166 [Phytophthora cactorum]
MLFTQCIVAVGDSSMTFYSMFRRMDGLVPAYATFSFAPSANTFARLDDGCERPRLVSCVGIVTTPPSTLSLFILSAALHPSKLLC